MSLHGSTDQLRAILGYPSLVKPAHVENEGKHDKDISFWGKESKKYRPPHFFLTWMKILFLGHCYSFHSVLSLSSLHWPAISSELWDPKYSLYANAKHFYFRYPETWMLTWATHTESQNFVITQTAGWVSFDLKGPKFTLYEIGKHVYSKSLETCMSTWTTHILSHTKSILGLISKGLMEIPSIQAYNSTQWNVFLTCQKRVVFQSVQMTCHKCKLIYVVIYGEGWICR